ncbi:phage terminase small subunit [Vibrio vulnificus]|uniref:phage terminase small subunit n=1 Tax=Vibrio vulnificus TaxID=672 RepID=UPI0010292754|nr:phage terminase small subunit [Vibrio vulnificus]RZP88987.1 hypothetical protein D8T54_20385 [Vibrio vulnificus]
MSSPLFARRKRLETLAISREVSPENTASAPESHVSESEWDLVRQSMDSHERALKGLKRIDDKEAYKKRHFAEYESYLLRQDLPGDLKVKFMIWLFDINDVARAVPYALECLDANLAMPERIKRDLPTWLFHTVFDWAERSFKQEHSVEPYFSNVFERVKAARTFEDLEGKYYKLAGLMALGAATTKVKHVSEPERLYQAKALFIQAQNLYPPVGVGTRLTEIDKRLLKLNMPLEPDTQA